VSSKLTPKKSERAIIDKMTQLRPRWVSVSCSVYLQFNLPPILLLTHSIELVKSNDKSCRPKFKLRIPEVAGRTGTMDGHTKTPSMAIVKNEKNGRQTQPDPSVPNQSTANQRYVPSVIPSNLTLSNSNSPFPPEPELEIPPRLGAMLESVTRTNPGLARKRYIEFLQNEEIGHMPVQEADQIKLYEHMIFSKLINLGQGSISLRGRKLISTRTKANITHRLVFGGHVYMVWS
jgi:hypothetical protein